MGRERDGIHGPFSPYLTALKHSNYVLRIFSLLAVLYRPFSLVHAMLQGF